MNNIRRAFALFMVLSSFSIITHAQTIVISNNFDSYSLGAFGSTYNDGSGGNVTSTIVAPGAGGAGQALQLSGNVTNGVSENAGVNSPVLTPSSNTDPNLSDYTLSFDLAISAGANSGVGVTLNIFGTGAADGSSYSVPISQNTVGGGFHHYSVNLGTLPSGYQIPVLNPTDNQYSFQLLFLGFNASVTAIPETIQLDNLQITVTANTGSYTDSINPLITYQTIQGLGGATAFYEGWIPAHPYALEIYTNAFAGLNLSMLRLGAWYRYSATPNFNSGGNDGQVAGEIVSNADRVLGHPVPVFMSSWSPPAFLKSNGSVDNGGTLVMTNGGFAYTNFAQYWYDSLQAYQSNGVSPTWISIQNEPDFTAGYDSCVLNPSEGVVNGTNYASYSKALAATYQLLSNNMASPPKLLGPECVGIGYNDVQNYAATMDSNSFYGVTHHLYGGSTDGSPDGYFATMSALTNVFPGKPHFMTEFGYPDLINTACLIHDCLTVEQDVGFNYWSLVWPYPGNALVQIENPYVSRSTWTNAPPGVTTDSHGWWLTPAYWAMKHFSYFVQPGYRRVNASDNNNYVRSSAYLSPDGLRLVVVLINTNATAAFPMNFNFGAFNVSKSSVYQTAGTNTYAGTNTFLSLGSLTNSQVLPPLSLTTVVLDQNLSIGAAMTGSNLTLSWPLVSSGFTLQSSTNLLSGNWVNVTSPAPQTNGLNYQVTLPATNTALFFRLSE